MAFGSIKGHAQQITMLRSTIQRGTVAHAYLFTGIPGIGKMTVAHGLAKALNCSSGLEADFCDDCSSCVMISGGTHPDVQVIQPDGDFIKITQIRTMQERLLYARFYERYRVVLIDRAETMNLQSANCLLKTIEEPPGNTVIILITPLPYQIPATIRSRCQRVAFQPLPSNQIEESLREMLGADSFGTYRLAAGMAGGSLGRALRWQETGMFARRQQLLALLSGPNPPRLNALLDCADELGEDRSELLELLDLLRLWIRDVMIAGETGAEADILNIDLAGEVMAAARRLSLPHLFRQEMLIAEVQAALKGPANPRLAMERLLLALALAPGGSEAATPVNDLTMPAN